MQQVYVRQVYVRQVYVRQVSKWLVRLSLVLRLPWADVACGIGRRACAPVYHGFKDVVKPTSGGAPTHLQPSGKQASNPRLAALRHICTPCTPAYLPKTGAEPGWAGPGGTGIRASHLDLLLLLLYINIYTILFHKRYAECAEYAETRESSAEPRFHRAPALASPAYPCTPCTPL